MAQDRSGKKEILDSLLHLQSIVKKVSDWRQLEAVWLREKLKLNGQQTAEALNYKVQTVHLIWHRWRKLGLKMFTENRSAGGRNNAYMSLEEEKELLEAMSQAAAKGELVTVDRIRQAYQERIGGDVALSTIYRMLHRHQWRKIAPRKRHPKTKPEIQETFKKN